MSQPQDLMIEYLVVHHSASEKHVCCDDIRKWHLERGWDDIGYHWLVNQHGELTQARPEEIPGAHAYGLNFRSLGICCIGHYELESPSESMLNALIEILVNLCLKYKLDSERIIGHSEVMRLTPQATQTKCPGEALAALLPTIRHSVQQRLDSAKHG